MATIKLSVWVITLNVPGKVRTCQKYDVKRRITDTIVLQVVGIRRQA